LGARAPGILDERSAAIVVPDAFSTNSNEVALLRILERRRAALGGQPEFHHVPGRLRLKADGLKCDPTVLALRSELAAASGVRSATGNPLTGSIVVLYDTQLLSPDVLSAALQENHPEIVDSGLCSWSEQFGAKVIESLLEKLVVALIAAMV
jgi:hypothetical protein